jgi:hypothetical protein
MNPSAVKQHPRTEAADPAGTLCSERKPNRISSTSSRSAGSRNGPFLGKEEVADRFAKDTSAHRPPALAQAVQIAENPLADPGNGVTPRLDSYILDMATVEQALWPTISPRTVRHEDTAVGRVYLDHLAG